MRLLEQARRLRVIASAGCDLCRVSHVVVEGVHVGRGLQADSFLIEGGGVLPIAQLAVAFRKVARPDGRIPRAVRLAGQTQRALQVRDGSLWIALVHVGRAGLSERIVQVILGAGTFVLRHALQMNLERAIKLTELRVADCEVAARQGIKRSRARSGQHSRLFKVWNRFIEVQTEHADRAQVDLHTGFGVRRMQGTRSFQGGAKDNVRLLVLLAAHQQGTLNGFDVHQHILGFRRLRCPVGGTEPRIDFARAALHGHDRPRFQHHLTRSQHFELRRLRHGVVQLIQHFFRATAMEQDLAAQQAKFPLIDRIATGARDRDPVLGG